MNHTNNTSSITVTEDADIECMALHNAKNEKQNTEYGNTYSRGEILISVFLGAIAGVMLILAVCILFSGTDCIYYNYIYKGG